MAEISNKILEVKDSDELQEMYCEMCFKGGTTLPALGYCMTCMEYFCGTCSRNHKRYLPNHKMLENGSLPADFCLEMCTIHKDELIKFYCKSCSLIGCSICQREKHKCKDKNSARPIPIYVKDLENGIELRRLTDEMTKVADKIANMKLRLENEKKGTANASEEIKKAKLSVCSKFDELENKIVFMLSEKSQTTDAGLQTINDLESRLGIISQETKYQTSSTNDQTCKSFIAIKRAENELKTIDIKLLDIQTNKANGSYKFEPNPKLAHLEAAVRDLGELGNLVDDNTNTGLKRNRSDTVERITATHVFDISAQDRQETNECSISRICFLSKNYMVVNDGNNNSVKLVDLSTRSVVHRRPVRSAANGIAAVESNEVAITQANDRNPDRGKIQFLLMTKKKQLVFKKNFLVTEMPCIDIQYHGSCLYVLMGSQSNEHKVQRLDMKGRVLESVSIDNRSLRPDFLALDARRGIIYLVETNNDSIIEIEKSSIKINQKYMLCRPFGITTDFEGAVYICEKGSYSVRLIDPDKKSESRCLLTKEDGLWRPYAIAYNNTEDRLYVAMETGNTVKVFDVHQKQYVRTATLEWIEHLVELK